ncbi:MAG: T9SS type A sorting domain-containing protein [Candidatus Eisenbacteria bacterium]|nr:T9SS type A sorting domain-containing protein [Candidatus Eisenbacteria bacterium]
MPAGTARAAGSRAMFAVAAACLIVLGGSPAVAATAAQTALPADPAPTVQFNVLESDPYHTLVEVIVPDAVSRRTIVEGSTYEVVGVPGASPWGEPGEPLLQVAATLVAVPPRSSVRTTVLERDVVSIGTRRIPPVPTPLPDGGVEVFVNESSYSRDALLPEEQVATGDPAILRDYRVVPLRVYPISHNPATGETKALRRALVRLEYGNGETTNALETRRPASRAFRPLYENSIANYEFVKTRYENDGQGRYVIITHDDYYSAVQPLAEWKHMRGMEVELAKLSQIGSSASSIKSYIQNAYNSWPSPPEFVLLVGDTEQLPTGSGGDDYYAKLSGSDYLVDVDLGRLSCDSVAQCELIVAKTLGYKRTPYMSDTDWFKSGCLIVRDDYDSSDATYYDDTWHAYDLMEGAGYVQIDTLFRKHGDDYNDVHAAVTDGRTFVNYRGQGVSNWWSPFDVNPNSTSPGYKLPVVMSATCGTGNFYNYDYYPCETWMRAGSVAEPKGSVAFVATAEIVSGGAHYRSCVNQGFYSAVFNLKLHSVATALNYGKLQVYQLYDDQYEYEGWNTQGDPELDIWTDTPQMLTVTHPSSVPSGSSNLVVEVEAGGSPVSKALVCAYLPGEVYKIGLTDLTGVATLSINPTTEDTVWITVSGHDLHPYEGSAEVTLSGPFLDYANHSTDDSAGGNGDGMVSPGETIELSVGIENIGPDPATSVNATLETADAYVALTDSVASYGDIPSGGTVTNPSPYTFTVGADCPHGHGLSFSLDATDSSRGSWTIVVPDITVSAGDLSYSGIVVDDSGTWGDGDGVLENGETAWLTLTLANDGDIGLAEVDGDLSTSDSYVAVTDGDGYFGEIAGAGGTATSAANSFRVSVDPSAPPGHEVSFVLAAAGDGGTYAHSEDLSFDLALGGSATETPSGPDSYGYYAYDSTDTWTGQAPTYSWVELVGTGSQISGITDEDAQTETISLPFTFRYYGTDYTQVSVNSNGFLAMGVEDYRFGDNSEIPDSHGPERMLAPFWDDLDPSDGGDVYQWHDSANHRFIVQYDACEHYGGGNPETFEVILYDPAHYPTSTGDGIIVYQYQDASFVYSMTMGIENASETDGIQYVYNSTYDQYAAPIADGLAVKFTTEPPEASDVWLVVDGMVVDDSGSGNGDGLAQPGETVELVMTIENRGEATASAVSATITSTDPDITVDDGSSSFGNIPGASTADNSTGPFVVTVASLPDDDSVELDVAISTGSRYVTTDVVTLVLDLSQSGIEDGEMPLRFALRQNCPNPFRAGTSIAYGLPRPSDVRIDVYNVAGRRVATLVDREMPAGWHTASWDGRDSGGNAVAAGMYFYRIDAGTRTASRKMVLVR